MLKCNSKTVDLNKFLLVPSWSEAGAVAFNFKGRLPQELSQPQFGVTENFQNCGIQNYPKVAFDIQWANKFYVNLSSFESRMELSPLDHY